MKTTNESRGVQPGRKQVKIGTKKDVKKTNTCRIAAPFFIQATENGALASRIQMEEEKLGDMVGWKLKIVERGGRQLRELVTKSNLFSKEFCGRTECMA